MSKNINDKLFDILVEEAVERHCSDISSENIDVHMNSAEAALMNKQKDAIYRKVKKEINGTGFHWSLRKTVILIAAIIAILAACLNASAIKRLLFNTISTVEDTKLKLETRASTYDQYNSIKNFRNKSEIIIPKLLPEGMELLKVEDCEDYLILRYKNNDSYITITETVLDAPQSIPLETDGNEYEISDCLVMGMTAKMAHMTYESGLSVYYVAWCSDNTNYLLVTTCDLGNTEKILKNLNYLEE